MTGLTTEQPTGRLRWYEPALSDEMRKQGWCSTTTLQQEWRNLETGKLTWRDVPTDH